MTTEPETPRCVVCGWQVTEGDDKIVFGPLLVGWSDETPGDTRVEYVLYSHKACRAGRVGHSNR